MFEAAGETGVQHWRKLGLVFCGNGQFPWMRSHAAVPFARHLRDDLFRVYFSTRDSCNRSVTGALTMDLPGDLSSPPKVLEILPEPVIAPGELGCFDDSGAMLSWITDVGDQRYYYYIGWNRGVTVPFRNALGLAIGAGEAVPVRYAPGPIVDRAPFEPHFVASACVLPGEGGWHMWYLSCTGWDLAGAQPVHRYHIKYASSPDGIAWRRRGQVAIDYASGDEYAISRPTVIRDGDLWRMWFSHRGRAYRIGYAESADAVNWRRLDGLVDLDVSGTGWDAEMIEYPHVFDHKGRRYMLYNGNGYGKSGFGLAVLDDA
jgi:hypothetical protein